MSVPTAPGNPSDGLGHYLRDVVYGALDGVITTLAIVSSTSVIAEMPWRHGVATAVAFAVVGAAPLLAYVIPRPDGLPLFGKAIVLSAVTLAIVGGLRARYVGKPGWRSAAEVLAIGVAAGGSAYFIGSAVGNAIR